MSLPFIYNLMDALATEESLQIMRRYFCTPISELFKVASMHRKCKLHII